MDFLFFSHGFFSCVVGIHEVLWQWYYELWQYFYLITIIMLGNANSQSDCLLLVAGILPLTTEICSRFLPISALVAGLKTG